MSSIYGKLFKYRSREGRSPLEDYLSEAIADILNRFPKDPMSELIGELFVPTSLLQGWRELVQTSESIRLETQYAIKEGRVDLVVTVDGRPAIAIENKVGAPLSSISQDDDQLTRYGTWIRTHKQKDAPAIVCLLTHLTRPNAEFYKGRNGGASPHVIKWSAVANTFRRVSQNSQLTSEIRMLCAELNLFLMENNMSGEFAGRDEFAAAIVYLRAGDRMDHTFSTIYSHLKSLPEPFTSNESVHEYSLHFATKDRLIWGWKYLSHPTLYGLFFAYGMALDPSGTFKSADSPPNDAAFICVGAEDKKSIAAFRAKRAVPQMPWTYAELSNWSAVISFRPLHEIMAEPEAFSQKMIDWIGSELTNVKNFVGDLS